MARPGLRRLPGRGLLEPPHRPTAAPHSGGSRDLPHRDRTTRRTGSPRYRDRRNAVARVWRTLAVAGVTALILSLPLLAWFARNPEWFTAHPADVSLTALAEAQFGGSLPAALAHNAGAVLGMFFLAGDPSTFHNLPNLPVFDPLSALLFVIGLGVLLAALVRQPGRQSGASATGPCSCSCGWR